jgi:hypothetical protein
MTSISQVRYLKYVKPQSRNWLKPSEADAVQAIAVMVVAADKKG